VFIEAKDDAGGGDKKPTPSFFYGPDALPVAQPRENIIFHGLGHESHYY